MARKQLLNSNHDFFCGFYDWFLESLKYCFWIIFGYTIGVLIGGVLEIIDKYTMLDKIALLNPGCNWFWKIWSIEKEGLSNFYTINAQVLFVFIGVTLPIIAFILERKSGLAPVERQNIIKSMVPLGFLWLLSFIFSIRGILKPSDFDNASITLFFTLSFFGGLLLLGIICVPHYLFNQPSVCRKEISGKIIEITNEDLKLRDEDSDLVSNRKAREIYIRYFDYNSNKKQRKFVRQDNGVKPDPGKFVQKDKIKVCKGNNIKDINVNISSIINDINKKYIELRIHWYPLNTMEKAILGISFAFFVISIFMPVLYFILWKSFIWFIVACAIIVIFASVIVAYQTGRKRKVALIK